MKSYWSLIESGVSVREKDSKGNEPLHYASEEGHVELAEALIKRGGEVNTLNGSLFTPLIMAILAKQVEVIIMLISHGALLNNFSGNGKGSSALEMACNTSLEVLNTKQ